MSGADHTTERIIRGALHALVAGDPVDVGKVAADVGVDRATIFRRVGRRDSLLAEAMWRAVAEIAWPKSLDAHPVGTPHRSAEVLRTFAQFLIEEEWFRLFLERDPQRALRILTTAATPVQSRMVALVAEVIDVEASPIDLPAAELAFLAVRVAESFVYADLIAGGTPNADAAYTVLVALLG